ncbi:microfibril-associated glycoprotein 4-like precursor [Danio rerio]|uniref:Microfibril-associated glycoprotein 4-like n=1 Tax=Danio rerio TaxID=7955 RepID=A0A2R8RUH9_DANRE|nr:microfibril-associated glycoprotein 4-like precursor [Danio rerio]|eukprot:NP_001315003.1 microfibril-associated glycoprotein 4-like precursor [Danio rerio]
MALIWFLAALVSVASAIDYRDRYKPLDCSHHYKSGERFSKVYTIHPDGDHPHHAFCHMVSDGRDEDNGGWTVIQRRMDGTLNFYQPWKEYKRGFGSMEGEHWMGLEHIHHMTRHKRHMLRVDMEDFEGRRGFAHYTSFSVASEDDGYKLHISGFRDGGAGDSLTAHNEMKFSTFDKDQDLYEKNCAREFLGGFWYKKCHHANPNGVYLWGHDRTHYAIGVCWWSWDHNYYNSLKHITMRIKPHDT